MQLIHWNDEMEFLSNQFAKKVVPESEACVAIDKYPTADLIDLFGGQSSQNWLGDALNHISKKSFIKASNFTNIGCSLGTFNKLGIPKHYLKCVTSINKNSEVSYLKGEPCSNCYPNQVCSTQYNGLCAEEDDNMGPRTIGLRSSNHEQEVVPRIPINNGGDIYNGVDGADGIPGKNGKDGDVGPQGIAGKDGAAGVEGPRGNDGSKGKDGATGVEGPRGKDGSNGKDGAAGVEGPPGNDGAVGVEGPRGKDGVAGVVGLPGTDGKVGRPGIPGKDGATGEQGPPGKDGAVPESSEKSESDLLDIFTIKFIPFWIVTLLVSTGVIISLLFSCQARKIARIVFEHKQNIFSN